MNNDERVDSPPDEPLGFELTAAATQLYADTDVTSRILGTLKEGDVVTVLERTYGFMRVVTVGDSFGYILDSTPMRRVADRVVDGWTVQIPEIEPVSIPMTARIPAPMDSKPPAPPDVSGLQGSRRREALTFLGRVNEKTDGDQSPDGQALLSGLAAATVGMIGLLLAHGLFRLSNNELMVFFAGDVLFPLFVLTGRPKAPNASLGIFTMLYYVALFGYAGLTT